ncbi:LOW QUALITY PROTEIN: hypothetical protein Dda_7510 [Drechslerella dactyloides]|uniref:Ribosome production factor 2 homolog n=1 Tax=Drechslerella dactyloides TaxID=74499 RepID=A0AAD6NGW4_DREDA|nr:LOW QUALITY PROTEIN: hypothetical protein Dda_7510 [Drechslerella dactyloides]
MPISTSILRAVSGDSTRVSHEVSVGMMTLYSAYTPNMEATVTYAHVGTFSSLVKTGLKSLRGAAEGLSKSVRERRGSVRGRRLRESMMVDGTPSLSRNDAFQGPSLFSFCINGSSYISKMESPRLPPRDALPYAACYCEENIYKLVEGYIPAASLPDYTILFLSNSKGTIPVFSQRAQKTPLFPVIWDYHVVLVHHPGRTLEELLQRSPKGNGSRVCHSGGERAGGAATSEDVAVIAQVYDFDSTIPAFPCSFKEYFSQTFSPPPVSHDVDPVDRMAMVQTLEQDKFRRYFRLVPAGVFLNYFCSGRGHMKNHDGSWKMPPPEWPEIKSGKAVQDTFAEYIDFKDCEGMEGGDLGEYLGVIVSEETLWDVFDGGELPGVGPPDLFRSLDWRLPEATEETHGIERTTQELLSKSSSPGTTVRDLIKRLPGTSKKSSNDPPTPQDVKSEPVAAVSPVHMFPPLPPPTPPPPDIPSTAAEAAARPTTRASKKRKSRPRGPAQTSPDPDSRRSQTRQHNAIRMAARQFPLRPSRTECWGQGLFQCQEHVDAVNKISEILDLQREENLWQPQDPLQVRKVVNLIIDKFLFYVLVEVEDEKERHTLMIIGAAVFMRLGCRLPYQFKDFTDKLFKKQLSETIDLSARSIQQVTQALQIYRPGNFYIFETAPLDMLPLLAESQNWERDLWGRDLDEVIAAANGIVSNSYRGIQGVEGSSRAAASLSKIKSKLSSDYNDDGYAYNDDENDGNDDFDSDDDGDDIDSDTDGDTDEEEEEEEGGEERRAISRGKRVGDTTPDMSQAQVSIGVTQPSELVRRPSTRAGETASMSLERIADADGPSRGPNHRGAARLFGRRGGGDDAGGGSTSNTNTTARGLMRGFKDLFISGLIPDSIPDPIPDPISILIPVQFLIRVQTQTLYLIAERQPNPPPHTLCQSRFLIPSHRSLLTYRYVMELLKLGWITSGCHLNRYITNAQLMLANTGQALLFIPSRHAIGTGDSSKPGCLGEAEDDAREHVYADLLVDGGVAVAAEDVVAAEGAGDEAVAAGFGFGKSAQGEHCCFVEEDKGAEVAGVGARGFQDQDELFAEAACLLAKPKRELEEYSAVLDEGICVHEGVREAHFRPVDEAVAQTLEEREGVMVGRVEDDGVDGSLRVATAGENAMVESERVEKERSSTVPAHEKKNATDPRRLACEIIERAWLRRPAEIRGQPRLPHWTPSRGPFEVRGKRVAELTLVFQRGDGRKTVLPGYPIEAAVMLGMALNSSNTMDAAWVTPASGRSSWPAASILYRSTRENSRRSRAGEKTKCVGADTSLGIENFSTRSFNFDDSALLNIDTPAATPPTMLQTIKPKNARSKRVQEAREPKLVENEKTTLFLRGTSASGIIQDALGDLHSLKKPHAVKFQKKNAVHPFEDASALEFFSRKNDASLMVFASHSKKRPHNLTFIRFFDYQVLDMVELLLDGETFRKMTDFKNAKAGVGLKPLLSFSGTIFDTNPTYTHLKLLLLDFFHGHTVTEVDVEALQYTIAISAANATDEDPLPKIHLRSYMLRTQRSGHKLPRVELEEMGPRMDFRIGRRQLAAEDTMKLAMARAKTQEMRTKKNISVDGMGDKIGRVHVGHQDLGQLQTRKMKGLRKRGRDDDDNSRNTRDDGDVEMEDDGNDDVEMESTSDVPAVSPKRPRV